MVRKRLQKEVESARRSRQRKQQHLDNLTAQISQLKSQNRQILSSCATTTQQYVAVEAENSILRAQFDELSNYYQSLNEIVRCLTTTTTVTATATTTTSDESDDYEGFGGFDLEIDDGFSVNPWGFGVSFGNNFFAMSTIDSFMC
ncbi:hypothetical protein RND81_05G225500 [Saponaria officinalis]|uniref:BZIP domain-containing protein n=1 Tax=Saponaria officinalis TaxID=3572 RepID=A0AAW1L0M6_SAPOF